MSELKSLEARIAAENAAIAQFFDFTDTAPRLMPDVTAFRDHTGQIMDTLALAVQGIARLCPEIARITYEARRAKSVENPKFVEMPGWPAYNLFIGYQNRPGKSYSTESSLPPFLQVSPSRGTLTVYAGCGLPSGDEKPSIEVSTEDSVGTQIIEGSMELKPGEAAFTFISNDDYVDLVLSRNADPEPPHLRGRPATHDDVAAALYDPSMLRAFEEGGLYGLGSYFVWRSARNLQEIVELPPNAI